ncbi:MAG: MBOAT family protein [Clostridiales bacterium]|nr:MBOAT family protein [Clostridiales bacterium]
MSIVSLPFLIFLLVTMTVFYICPVKFRWGVLLAASICFYVIVGKWIFLPVMIAEALIVWGGSFLIDRRYRAQDWIIKNGDGDKSFKNGIKKKYKKKCRRILVLTLTAVIGLLVFLKFARYLDEFLSGLFDMTNGSFIRAEMLIIPLGISYYTFSMAGYLLDVYWRREEHERNFLRFLLFAIYFPHIIQGPISRYNELGVELKKELRYERTRVAHGMQLMIYGFFKKLVIADRLNMVVSSIYDGRVHSGSIFVFAVFFDVVQIYTDFSGYMDIVTGASQIFGVTLEKNFDHPFFSKTVTEFWRRWHITLGGWFRDYVYMPVTLSSKMKKLNKFSKKHFPQAVSRFITVFIPVMITWIFMGLWHGTGMPYLIWGLYYGTLICLSELLAPFFRKTNEKLGFRDDSFFFNLFRMARTGLIFAGGRLLTRPGGLKNTKMVLGQIFTDLRPWKFFDDSIFYYNISSRQLNVVLLAILAVWGVSMLQRKGSVCEMLDRQHLIVRWAIIYAAFFAVLIFGVYGPKFDPASFIYMQY